MSDTAPVNTVFEATDRSEFLTLGRLHATAGFAYGFRQPSLLAQIFVVPSPGIAELARRFKKAIAPHIPPPSAMNLIGPDDGPRGEAKGLADIRDLLNALGYAVAALQEGAGLCVAHPAKVTAHTPAASSAPDRHGTAWVIVLPTYAPKAALEALRAVVSLCTAMMRAPTQIDLTDAQGAELTALIERIERSAPSGTNNRHFIRAAHELNIPCLPLAGGVMQYGLGKNARLFLSSMSDATSAIGTSLAKDKGATNTMLRLAGLPVPEQQRVETLEEALAAARRIGFPVVVKPANLDQGTGVESGLASEDELTLAYHRSARHSKNTIIERHVAGQDHRINVLHGKMIGAVHRIPAGVTGDGVSSIQGLIDEINKDPRRSDRRYSVMKPVTINDEARELLAAAGLNLQSVLKAGQFLALRRASNVSSGGHTVGVMDRIHPDNAWICEQAAKVLRLDIAGVDLLVPDISRSWSETAGAICEVNGMPQIGLTYPQIFAQLFASYLPGNGRIPVALVLSTSETSEFALRTVAALKEAGLIGGATTPTSLISQEMQTPVTRKTVLEGARALFLNPDIGAAVVVTDGADFANMGLPADCIDLLLVEDWSGADEQLARTLMFIRPHLTGSVLVPHGDPRAGMISRAFGSERVRTVRIGENGSSCEALAQAVAQALQAGAAKTSTPAPR